MRIEPRVSPRRQTGLFRSQGSAIGTPLCESLERRALLSISFSDPTTIQVGDQPLAITLADLNADGSPDLAVGLRAGIAVLLNDGTGQFGAPKIFSHPSPASSISVGDVDGDGIPDIVAGSLGATVIGKRVFVYIGLGGGEFEEPVEYDAGQTVSSLGLSDVNGDGFLDIVATNPGTNVLSVLLNEGDGTFGARQTRATGANPQSLVLADVTGNGQLDAVLLAFADLQIVIHQGVGNGSFEDAVTIESPSNPRAVRVADFTGDGLLDLLVASGDESVGHLTLHAGLGGGAFGPGVVTELTFPPLNNGLAIGDLNLDGRPDAVPNNSGGGAGEARLFGVGGVFDTAVPFETAGFSNTGVALADIDGDGDLDLVTSQGTDGTVTVFRLLRQPTIGSLVSTGAVLPGGASFTLTANDVSDPDGEVVRVRFYIDLNGNGVGDEGELLFVDSNGANGWSFSGTVTDEYPLGPVSFLAIAEDNDGAFSVPVALPVSIVYSTLAGDQARITGTSAPGNLHAVAGLNFTGLPIVFEQITDTGWSVRDLVAATGSPVPSGDPVAWTDPTDARLFVFAPSAAGLIAFWRRNDGTWAFQNLTESVEGGRGIASAVTVFADVSGRLHVAGLDADGDLVLYVRTGTNEDGSAAWSFENISETHLRARGQDTPAWVGPIISYVTRWDGLNIAALDGSGRIQVVWTSPELGHWRVDDLSAITGAPALSGGLTAYLTTWDGINLAGLDGSGKVSVTWWVPSFGGDWETSNLTDLFGGPTLQGFGLTSYVTPWGGLNVAGLDASGDLTIYWWVPEFADDPENDAWVISNLSDGFEEGTPDPAGQITSHASDAGTLNLFGAAAGGEILRYFWNPGDGGNWSAQDLSTTAGRL
ncbi:MAG TPA: VCBS repeat-containing protein [Phycisphaerales bacterium]|nr:VCBS repeat-containing protein [Phycisphaerales bacterium]